MIQMETVLNAADNSGARSVKCFKVIGGSKKRYARVGDIIVVSIKEALANSKVQKGTVHKAVVVRTAKEIQRDDGSTIKFDENNQAWPKVYLKQVQSGKIVALGRKAM